MKRIVLAGLCAVAATGVGYSLYPDEAALALAAVGTATIRVWEAVQANPFPVLIALGTFVLTVVYHTAKGKSLRESVEVAATRVAVVAVPQPPAAEDENPVVARAKARAMRAQLLADQIGLQNRQRKLPEELVKAEKESCYSEQALADAERTLAAKRKAHEEAVARLEELLQEDAAQEKELAEIEAELKRLSELV